MIKKHVHKCYHIIYCIWLSVNGKNLKQSKSVTICNRFINKNKPILLQVIQSQWNQQMYYLSFDMRDFRIGSKISIDSKTHECFIGLSACCGKDMSQQGDIKKNVLLFD